MAIINTMHNGKTNINDNNTRKRWLFHNKPTDGYWYCTYCSKPLTTDKDMLAMGVERLTLDHYHTRSRHPELRYDIKNLVPSCFRCNYAKGSIDGDDYVKKIKAV